MVTGFSVQVSVSWFKGSRFKGSKVRKKRNRKDETLNPGADT
jgi:hypothetical protein